MSTSGLSVRLSYLRLYFAVHSDMMSPADLGRTRHLGGSNRQPWEKSWQREREASLAASKDRRELADRR